jgi:hypothetical protein
MMSDTKVPKEKKSRKVPVVVTPDDLKAARAVAVLEYPLADIKKALKCSWKKAAIVRHQLIKEGK